MTFSALDLADFGWTDFFASQCASNDDAVPVRVLAVHRGAVRIAGPGLDTTIPPFVGEADDEEAVATVGDWLLLDPRTGRPRRLLRRRSVFKRRAAGTGRSLQLIAANVDTLFIVSSCNQDFNVARLERYLALAREADVTPLVVLTKSDLAESPASFVDAAVGLLPDLVVRVLDARMPDDVAALAPWCTRGRTIALIGSSGVGKSTLINTLTGSGAIATQGIRAGDDKGQHTTTGRTLHRLPMGGWLMDTPGMRELQLSDVRAGLDDVYSDIVALAGACRFGDCRHDSEPGCAVRAAIDAGTLDDDRLRRWRKLIAEEAHNTESLAQRRARSRAFGKMARRVMKDKRTRWQD
ncbi:ribosome small subunit-dependent GTPase A [Reyranella sp. CPCC 100927]|nr:ribosome small subunit-dependent GTPase A [Reyranella sp. CPCC 100927]